MNRRTILAIASKDLVEVRQNRFVWLPMIILPLIFVVMMPLAMILIPTSMDMSADSLTTDSDMQLFLANMPQELRNSLEGLNAMQSFLVLMLGYLFAPLFLIFPLMFSTVIASESFAGERERKTMEALLYTPATDAELFLGKALAALVPAILITVGSFLGYIIVLNTAGWQIFGRIWFPLASWYPLIFWISPALALLGVSVTVLISARTQTFMGAYQTSSSLVVVILGLMMGQFAGVVYLSVWSGMLIGAVMWLIAGIATAVAIRSFQRHKLLVNQTA